MAVRGRASPKRKAGAASKPDPMELPCCQGWERAPQGLCCSGEPCQHPGVLRQGCWQLRVWGDLQGDAFLQITAPHVPQMPPFHLYTPKPPGSMGGRMTLLSPWGRMAGKRERALLKINWETTPGKRRRCIFNRPYACSIMSPQLAGLTAAASSSVPPRVSGRYLNLQGDKVAGGWGWPCPHAVPTSTPLCSGKLVLNDPKNQQARR